MIPPLAPLLTSNPEAEHCDAEPWYVERAMLTEYVILSMDTLVGCPTVDAFLMERVLDAIDINVSLGCHHATNI